MAIRRYNSYHITTLSAMAKTSVTSVLNCALQQSHAVATGRHRSSPKGMYSMLLLLFTVESKNFPFNLYLYSEQLYTGMQLSARHIK